MLLLSIQISRLRIRAAKALFAASSGLHGLGMRIIESEERRWFAHAHAREEAGHADQA